jgi:hypothetical protein
MTRSGAVRARPAWFLPAPADAVCLFPPVFLFARLGGAQLLLGDGDTGWHIRAGEWILRNRAVPTHDLFSFTRPGAEWFAWEWLWDACAAALHRCGGMPAVVFASVATIAATSLLVYGLAVRAGASAPVAAAVTIVASAISSVHWLARPHLVSVLFAALALRLLERTRKNPGWLWSLPLLILLWTQLHGGFPIGIVFIAAYAVEAAARRDFRLAAAYTACAAVSSLASLLNPYGWRLHAHMISYLADTAHFRNIEEFQPLAFDHPLAVWFGGALIGGALAALWLCKSKRLAWPLLLVFWGYLALRSARHIPIYLVVAAPAIALAASTALRRTAFTKRRSDFGQAFPDTAARLPAITGLAAVAALLFSPAPPPAFRAGFSPERYPVAAVAALERDLARLRVFTSDDWGDYLIYRLAPKVRVFIDGRTDFYGTDFGERYETLIYLKDGWQDELNRLSIDAILMPSHARLTRALRTCARWRLAHDDGIAAFFVPAAGNQDFPMNSRVPAPETTPQENRSESYFDRLPG